MVADVMKKVNLIVKLLHFLKPVLLPLLKTKLNKQVTPLIKWVEYMEKNSSKTNSEN